LYCAKQGLQQQSWKSGFWADSRQLFSNPANLQFAGDSGKIRPLVGFGIA
jgi:hypothetical protein